MFEDGDGLVVVDIDCSLVSPKFPLQAINCHKTVHTKVMMTYSRVVTLLRYDNLFMESFCRLLVSNIIKIFKVTFVRVPFTTLI